MKMNVKRFLAIAMLVVLVLSAVGCSGGSKFKTTLDGELDAGNYLVKINKDMEFTPNTQSDGNFEMTMYTWEDSTSAIAFGATPYPEGVEFTKEIAEMSMKEMETTFAGMGEMDVSPMEEITINGVTGYSQQLNITVAGQKMSVNTIVYPKDNNLFLGSVITESKSFADASKLLFEMLNSITMK